MLPVFQTWLEQTKYTKRWRAALDDGPDGTVGLRKIIGLYRDEIISSLRVYENYGPDSCAPAMVMPCDIGDPTDAQRRSGQGCEGLKLKAIQIGKSKARWRQYMW